MFSTVFRTRHWLGVTLAAALCALACALPPAADAARQRRPACDAGKTWAANAQLRLFLWGDNGVTVRVWVCRARARRAHFLVSRNSGTSDPSAAIAGNLVLFPRRSCDTIDGKSIDNATCRGGISIYNARTNSTRFVRVGRSADDIVPLFGAIAVTARGWGAWVTTDASNFDHQAVWILPPGGAPQLVAETNTGVVDDAATALALNGDRLFWQVGDQLGTRLLR